MMDLELNLLKQNYRFSTLNVMYPEKCFEVVELDVSPCV